jgi:hypothetical protein
MRQAGNRLRLIDYGCENGFVSKRTFPGKTPRPAHSRETLSVSVKKPTRKWHIWFFADTRANAQKTKRAIFCQRTNRRTDRKK